uniref:Uncharacterized protein n=1 Tax=candidate division CPR3 bacterium TaxID=2268181 RepID=A0A7C4R4K0_UNCC3
MNSKNLQEKFPEVYNGLFSKCNIVVSAPCVFHWAGEYTMNFGGPSLSQKLPFRIYVGIEMIGKKGEIRLGDFILFTQSSKHFKDCSYASQKEYYNIKFLNNIKNRVCELNGGDKDFDGFIIHTIFEGPRNVGLNTNSAFLLATFTAISLLYKKIDLEDYNNAQKMNLENLIDFDKFNYILRETWKMNIDANDGISSGASIFNSMVNSEYPILYWSQKVDKNDDISSIKKGINCPKEEIDNIKYWAYDIGKMFNLEKTPIWNVDISMLYPGRDKPISRVSRSICNVENYLKQTLDFTKNNFSKIKDEKELSSFFKTLQKGDAEKIRRKYSDFLSYITVDIVKSLKETYSQDSDSSFLNLVNSINNYNNMVYFLNNRSELVDMVCDYIKNRFKDDINTIGIATKVCGLGKGGDVLVASQYSSSLPNTIYELREEIIRHTKTECFLDYLSWEDGFGKEGLIVEQFTDENLYSKFISRDVVSLSKIDKEGNLINSIMKKDKFDQEKESIDVLLDIVKNNIFINGEAMTSKEIYSARYTIEFLNILLKNKNKEVSNKELPRSSYSTNRNEFQGKILVPLQKEIKKRTGRDLVINISGTADNFKLKLKDTNCNICFLEKVF